MPHNTEKQLKTYYTINEVAKMFGLSTSTLRYWETEFPHLRPKTMARGVRQYQEKDIEEIRNIYTLIKERGFKISAARKMLHLNRTGTDKSSKILQNLIDVRDELMELKEALDRIV